jgi:hypothetical protein
MVRVLLRRSWPVPPIQTYSAAGGEHVMAVKGGSVAALLQVCRLSRNRPAERC